MTHDILRFLISSEHSLFSSQHGSSKVAAQQLWSRAVHCMHALAAPVLESRRSTGTMESHNAAELNLVQQGQIDSSILKR